MTGQRIACIRFAPEPLWGGPERFEPVSGLPGGTRTPDLRLRRPLLYPVELRADGSKAHRVSL